MHEDIDIANSPDDNTPYTFAKNIVDVIEFLKQASVSLFKSFELNLSKGNMDQCYFLTSTD